MMVENIDKVLDEVSLSGPDMKPLAEYKITVYKNSAELEGPFTGSFEDYLKFEEVVLSVKQSMLRQLYQKKVRVEMDIMTGKPISDTTGKPLSEEMTLNVGD